MLRTIFVLSIIAGFAVFAVQSPFYALLFYLWISYFRPELWVWTGLIQSLNLQWTVGLWVVLFTLFSTPRIRFGIGPLLLLLLLLQGFLSTFQSLAAGWAWLYWQEFAKAILIGYLMILLVTTEARLRLALMVMSVSLAFEGAKQGWAQLILNPGARNDNTWVMLGDNNGVAIGMLMLLSLLAGLIRTSSSTFRGRLERNIGRFLAIGVAYRAVSTYSRGGFLACGGLILHAVLRSRQRLRALVALAVVSAVILPVLPAEFWDRMSTIQMTAEGEYLDGSTAGRFHYWQVAVEMANDRPLLGIGQNAFNFVYDRYDWTNGRFGRGRSVHSQWFGMLAELGYPGFVLFVLILAWAFFICWRTRRLARRRPELAALAHYATAIEGALVVAVIGGTFFPFQYNEMLWHVIALSMVVEQLTREQVAVPAVAPATAPAPVPVPLAVARRTSG